MALFFTPFINQKNSTWREGKMNTVNETIDTKAYLMNVILTETANISSFHDQISAYIDAVIESYQHKKWAELELFKLKNNDGIE